VSIATAFQEELPRLGLTQRELARLTSYSRQAVTAWANGRRRVPDEAKAELARVSPRIALELCAACPANIFSAGWLNGQVDLSLMAVTTKLAEELEELAEALRKLRLVNKTKPEHLDEEDRKTLLAAWQEALDVVTGIEVWMIRGAQDYRLDLTGEARKHRAKLVARRYRKKEPAPRKKPAVKINYA